MDFRIKIQCQNPECRDTQWVTLQNVSLEYATVYCGILDGRSDLYMSSPRNEVRSKIGRCGMCNDNFNAEVEG